MPGVSGLARGSGCGVSTAGLAGSVDYSGSVGLAGSVLVAGSGVELELP